MDFLLNFDSRLSGTVSPACGCTNNCSGACAGACGGCTGCAGAK